MKSVKQGKIVFDRNMKQLRGRTDRFITSFEDIQLKDLYFFEHPDENIIEEYDEPYRKNLDIWDIEIIIQTKT
jgi:hypothetical protein